VSVRPASGSSISICEHCRQRSQCKECGGGNMCEHGKRRDKCKECGGGGICEHGRRRSECKECGGGGICGHGRRRSECKECGGGSICKHGRQRSKCKECGGGSICEHGRRRTRCKECKECAVLAMGEDGLFDFLDVLSEFHVETAVGLDLLLVYNRGNRTYSPPLPSLATGRTVAGGRDYVYAEN
jgi:hypothetical protein